MDEKRAKQLENAITCLFNDYDNAPVENYKMNELTVRAVKHKGYWYLEVHDWKSSGSIEGEHIG